MSEIILPLLGIFAVFGFGWLIGHTSPHGATQPKAEPPVFGKHYCVLHWPGNTPDYTVEAYDTDLEWSFYTRDYAEGFMHFMDSRKEFQS